MLARRGQVVIFGHFGSGRGQVVMSAHVGSRGGQVFLLMLAQEGAGSYFCPCWLRRGAGSYLCPCWLGRLARGQWLTCGRREERAQLLLLAGQAGITLITLETQCGARRQSSII
jgi:hypothetical protein